MIRSASSGAFGRSTRSPSSSSGTSSHGTHRPQRVAAAQRADPAVDGLAAVLQQAAHAVPRPGSRTPTPPGGTASCRRAPASAAPRRPRRRPRPAANAHRAASRRPADIAPRPHAAGRGRSRPRARRRRAGAGRPGPPGAPSRSSTQVHSVPAPCGPRRRRGRRPRLRACSAVNGTGGPLSHRCTRSSREHGDQRVGVVVAVRAQHDLAPRPGGGARAWALHRPTLARARAGGQRARGARVAQAGTRAAARCVR